MTGLTFVKSDYRANSHNHRLRFGAPSRVIKLSKSCHFSAFQPGAVFGYIRWSQNSFGTVNWHFIIARSSVAGRQSSFPGIHPGINLLFRARGVQAVKTSLSWLDRVEKTASMPLDHVPIAFWRKAENARVIRSKLPAFKPKTLEPFCV